MLTKKRMALITALLTAVYFSVIWVFLPESVVGPRSQNMALLAAKVAFLGATSAFVTSVALIAVFRQDFVKVQMNTLMRFRHLLFLLVKRDFVARYRRSALGVVWSLLNPLLTMLVMSMVFTYLLARDIEYFPVYLICGLVIFNFFRDSTTAAMGSIVAAGPVIRKVYVPKYVFPVAKVASSLVNLLLSLVPLALVAMVSGTPFRWTMLLVPIPILYVFLFSVGVGMILASISVFFRDITYLYGVFTLLLMYMSAIFYSAGQLPFWVQQVLGLNPIYQYIDYFRNLILYGRLPGLWANSVCFGFAMAALCCGIYVTMTQQNKYILYV